MLTRCVETELGPVEYTEAGAGDVVLYFHGTGVTAEAMVRVESAMIAEGFRLIVPNRAGYGKTPLSPHGSAAGFGSLAAALLDVLGLPAVHVMGSSGGAPFAVSFALCHPCRARSLLLMCPQLHRWDDRRWLPANSRWTLPLLKSALLRKALLKSYRFQLARMSVEQYLKTQAGDRYPDVARDPAAEEFCREALVAMREGTRYKGFENDFLVFLAEDVVGPHRSIPPTLILHDVMDPVAPVEHVDSFVATFPQCERVSLRAAGHLVWVGLDAGLMHETRARFLRDTGPQRQPGCTP
jgi:pimeloyl-ACP methyl ester carboxylesterase